MKRSGEAEEVEVRGPKESEVSRQKEKKYDVHAGIRSRCSSRTEIKRVYGCRAARSRANSGYAAEMTKDIVVVH